MHKAKINKKLVALFTVIAIAVFALINFNHWAISHAESNSDFNYVGEYVQYGDLDVATSTDIVYDEGKRIIVVLFDGVVKVRNHEKSNTSLTCIKVADNVRVKIGLAGVAVYAQHSPFISFGDDSNAEIDLIENSRNEICCSQWPAIQTRDS